MQSTCSRSMRACARAVSIKANACVCLPADWRASPSTWPSSTRATLRCSEENSSARIFIRDAALCFADAFDARVKRFLERIALCPFHDGETVGLAKIFFEPGRKNLLWRVQSIEVNVIQSHAALAICVHERERGRLDARS